MKTNKIMIRNMGRFEVHQRTKDGMFNATDLLKQWNRQTGQKKKLDHFFENKSTDEFIDVLCEDIADKQMDKNLHTRNSVYVKSRASRGANAGTWMHPYLFIDFAMWLNPKFKYQVIKFVHDQLIEQRHEAGDLYRILGRAVTKFKDANYAQVAKGLNYIVFGVHDSELRQKATPQQLKELVDLQKKLAFAVDMGYIKTYESLIAEMRRMFRIKWQHQLTA